VRIGGVEKRIELSVRMMTWMMSWMMDMRIGNDTAEEEEGGGRGDAAECVSSPDISTSHRQSLSLQLFLRGRIVNNLGNPFP
jgi:hypothetical protein